jgi:hypothetical protein
VHDLEADVPIRPKYGRALAGLGLIGVGLLVLTSAALLPLGYFMAESENLGLLVASMSLLAVVGIVVTATGRSILTP